MTKKIALRLALLVVIIGAGVAYIAFDVLQYRIGSQGYAVTVELPRSGGLFTGSYAAYRGVDIGRVTRLAITDHGVDATVVVNPGTRIPAASVAAVRDLSAVGEQYVDFTPTGPGTAGTGPWLHAGSVVPPSSTTVPITVETVLSDASAFTNSIDTKTLSQLLGTTATAFQGTGPQLRTLLDATERLFSTLETVQPQTNTLIDAGSTLLSTTQATNPTVRNFAADLAGLTAQLDTSNSDISKLLTNGTAATSALQSLLAADTAPITALTADSATVTGVLASHNPAVQSLLAVLPTVTAALGTTVYGGELHAHFFLNDAEPLCTYITSPLNEPTGHGDSAVFGRTCPTSAPNLLQRGAANEPEAP